MSTVALTAETFEETVSPNGTILSTTSDDSAVRLWDVATQQQIGPPITAAPVDADLARLRDRKARPAAVTLLV